MVRYNCSELILRYRVVQNRKALTKMRLKLIAVKSASDAEVVTTISDLQAKKAMDVFQDEKHTLKITIPDPDFEKINAYVDCSICGKGSDSPLGKAFGCEVCHRSQCVAAPKVTFKCEVADETGSLPLTFFTETREMLFGLSAADIFHMRHSGDTASVETVQERLQTTPVCIQIAPSTSLSRNKVLQWVLQSITIPKDWKQERSMQEKRPAKRRLIIPAKSSSSDDTEVEQAIEEAMLSVISTMSLANGDNFNDPSPSATPQTLLNA